MHYAAKSNAVDKTELLRYLSFIVEPSYARDVNALANIQSSSKPSTIRPMHSHVQLPMLPTHFYAHTTTTTTSPSKSSGSGSGGLKSTGTEMIVDESKLTTRTIVTAKSLALKKLVEADAKAAIPGATPGMVIKQGWLSKRGFKTASIWRKRWVVLTTDTLNYYHTEKDTVPRDSLSLREKDCITAEPSEVRYCALDITMAEGAGSAAKAREKISLLADNEKEMYEWINLLTAVAGTDATPLRYTAVRTISPILSDALFSSRNTNYETPLHMLCGVNTNDSGANKAEAEKLLPSTAAWLINRNCPVNSANLKGKSPLFLAIESGRYHLGLLLLRYGATVPPHCASKDRFLSFVGEENSPEKVIAALQFLPKPVRLRNFHYYSIEILQHFIGSAP